MLFPSQLIAVCLRVDEFCVYSEMAMADNESLLAWNRYTKYLSSYETSKRMDHSLKRIIATSILWICGLGMKEFGEVLFHG